MFTKRPRVDRENELNWLLNLAAGSTAPRIALVRATSGMGKSELLREFGRRCPATVRQVPIDFKGGGFSLAQVFFHVCDALGGWAHFQNLARAIKGVLAPATVTITGNMQWGENDINVALGGPDEQTRDLRRSDLTHAWITDVRALGQVALVFDTFEKCDADLQRWLTSALLPAAHRSPQLLVVVAGQTMPDSSPMWECEEMELTAIAPEHWLAYAKAIGVQVDLKHLEGCCGIVNGHCSTVAAYLDGLRNRA